LHFRFRPSIVACLWVTLALPGIAHAWWDDAWAFRKPITVDSTPSGAGIGASVDNPTVLVRLHVGNFGYFGDTLPDGADIRFIGADDKTPLPFYVEKYDPAAGMAFIWVKLPRLAAGSSETVYMYYGNPAAKAASDAGASYDVNTALVYNFLDGEVRDSTRYANEPVASTASPSPAAVVGIGARFDGQQSIVVAGSPSLRLAPADGLTASAWLNADQEQADAIVVAATDPSGAGVTLGLSALVPYVRVTGPGGTAETPLAAALTAGSWHLVTATVGGGVARLYVDGVLAGEAPVTPGEVGGEFTIGSGAAGVGGLAGQLDVVRIDNVARSADWVKAQFANQGQADSLLRYGEDTAKEAGAEPSYFLITLQNVTLDGWVVIVFLTLMSIASWIIMITKTLTIRRVRKDNDAFIADFRKQTSANLDALDADDDDSEAGSHEILSALSGGHDHYQSSTLYHLYHAGIQQAHMRLAGATAGAARVDVLTPQGLDAIRATIDATNVRETQKLNRQMVLLTLAIAGGPFLGLLGTVVGVMITFAAIAASGDVNVNSIAPGIAAALAATVAGLAVAIPALFGYNWLSSQIKEVVADNRVFIDEFVTRLAERYS
jgi:biopolymer transport protein ExbB